MPGANADGATVCALLDPAAAPEREETPLPAYVDRGEFDRVMECADRMYPHVRKLYRARLERIHALGWDVSAYMARDCVLRPGTPTLECLDGTPHVKSTTEWVRQNRGMLPDIFNRHAFEFADVLWWEWEDDDVHKYLDSMGRL